MKSNYLDMTVKRLMGFHKERAGGFRTNAEALEWSDAAKQVIRPGMVEKDKNLTVREFLKKEKE